MGFVFLFYVKLEYEVYKEEYLFFIILILFFEESGVLGVIEGSLIDLVCLNLFGNEGYL